MMTINSVIQQFRLPLPDPARGTKRNAFQQVSVSFDGIMLYHVPTIMRLLDHSYIKLMMGKDQDQYPGAKGFSLPDIVVMSKLLPSEAANVVMTRLDHSLLMEYLLAQLIWMGDHQQSIIGEFSLELLTAQLREFRQKLDNPTTITFQAWKR